MLALTSQNAD